MPRSSRSRPPLLAAALLALGLSACGDGEPASTETAVENALSQPVMIGFEGQQVAACPGVGTPKANLALRLGPDDDAEEVATLRPGDTFFICGFGLDGQWLSVVAGEDADSCGVGDPAPQPVRYSGPCPSGWIPAEAVTVLQRNQDETSDPAN